jgi:hypothetical protein
MIIQNKTAALESLTLLLRSNAKMNSALLLASAAQVENSTPCLSQWRSQWLMESSFQSIHGNVVFTGVLSFLAAALASAAGVGSLFVGDPQHRQQAQPQDGDRVRKVHGHRLLLAQRALHGLPPRPQARL